MFVKKRIRCIAGMSVLAMAATAGSAGFTTPLDHIHAPAEKRPVYAIAHGANDVDSLRRALDAGANGVEIDICSSEEASVMPPWYVAHDCDKSKGELSTTDMFRQITNLRDTKKILLVWLDIKNPDNCKNSASDCSTRGLAEQAKILTNANIQVLYDLTSENFDKNKDTLSQEGYRNLASSMTARDKNGVPMEGVGLWANTRASSEGRSI